MTTKIVITGPSNIISPRNARRFFEDINARFQRGDDLKKGIEGNIESDYRTTTSVELTYTGDTKQSELKFEGPDEQVNDIARKLEEGKYIP